MNLDNEEHLLTFETENFRAGVDYAHCSIWAHLPFVFGFLNLCLL